MRYFSKHNTLIVLLSVLLMAFAAPCPSSAKPSAVPDGKILFEIGKQDGSASEFALYPDRFGEFLRKFSGVKTYYVGYSDAGRDWPYVFPGPLDHWGGGGYWAGYYPRHFPMIQFGLEKAPVEGTCVLEVFFAGVSSRSNPVWRIDVNGHRKEFTLYGDAPDGLLTAKEKGNPKSIKMEFPSSWLKKGMNGIRMGQMSGHWSVFDCIRLSCPGVAVLEKASSTLIRSVEAAGFEYMKGGRRYQPVLVDMIQYDRSRELVFETGGKKTVRVVEKGESIQEILLPAVKKEKEQEFVIREGDNIIYSGMITRSPEPLHRYTDYVDLLMGTGNSRWMFKPGPSLPLSMVQIAPDNQDETWKAGYEYTVDNIMGFNHFSDWTMTGFIMQPTCGELHVNPGREEYPDEGYRSRIDKSSEEARIGKYSVFMTDTGIKAEVSSTRRAAIQRYIFPKRDDARIIVDMFAPNEYPHNLKEAVIERNGNSEITGHATYYNAFTGYSLEQEYTLYFVLQFSKPFDAMNGWTNDGVEPVTSYIWSWDRNHEFGSVPEISYDVKRIEGRGDAGVFLDFRTDEGEEILVRSGVSLVDLDGARNNLEKELSGPFGWDFEKVEENAVRIWNDYLGRIDIETDDYLQKRKFYTNLYRALAAKAIWSDFDGRYVDEKENVRRLDSPDDCIVSGEYWNTFWDNQQLFNLMAPEISSAWARSAIQLYRNSGWFNTDPAGVEHTGVMVAMHCISQIFGAWMSGIRDFDLEEAYEGLKKMMTSSPEKYEGGGTVGVENLDPYMKFGYIPLGWGMVSNTMEYAYDDWCLGQMAKHLGREDDHDYFNKRSESWKNLFDPDTGFLRPKDDKGNWVEPFDPYHTPGFTEGNAFNYTWFVPQNPEELIRMVGKDRFVERLNQAMEKSAHANFNASGDDFANYPINHGNETSMEVAYLFNWAGEPHLTQKWVRAIQEQYYGTTPYDAYPGDEDLGQMSSWFVMSAIGLFQMNGGCDWKDPYYELGTPRYRKITIRLDGRYGRGKSFVIEAAGASAENKYVQSAELNGKPLENFRIPVSEVLGGGRLVLEMTDEASVCHAQDMHDDYVELSDTKPHDGEEVWKKAGEKLHLAWGSTNVRYRKHDVPDLDGNTAAGLSAWIGEMVNAQAVLWSAAGYRNIEVTMGDLRNGSHVIPASAASGHFVRYVMTDELNKDGRGGCGHRPDKAAWDSSIVADVLDIRKTRNLEPCSVQPVWFRINIPDDAVPGIYRGTVTVKGDDMKPEKLDLKIRVLDRTLPKPEDRRFHLDIWQNPYAVARYHGVPLWSDEHFELMRPLMKMLADAGQRTITASIMHKPWDGQTEDHYDSMITRIKKIDGTWSYDYTVFDKWVSFMMDEVGIRDMICCFTLVPWSLAFDYYDQATSRVLFVKASPGDPEYEDYWLPFLKDFAAHLRQKRWFGKTMISMDERPMEHMKEVIRLVREADPEFKISLAGSYNDEIQQYIHYLTIPYGNYFPEEVIRERRSKGQVSCMYTCCAEAFPNIFTFSDPAEGAWTVLSALAGGYDGYLRWAFNSWTEDPLRDSRFRRFAAGDTYMVYPGPRSSIRFEKILEGLQACEKIFMLREELEAKGEKARLHVLETCVGKFTSEGIYDSGMTASEMLEELYAILNESYGN